MPIWISIPDEASDSGGVFGFLVDLTPWIDGLAKAAGEFSIVNQDGEAILSSDPGAMMQGDTRKGVRHGAIGDALRGALLGKTGVTAFSFDGTDSLISYSPVVGTDWGLTRLIPVRDATYSQTTGSLNLVLVGLGCLLVMGTVVYIYSGSFVNPIRRLSDATSVLASGNLDQQVKVASNDEIGTLADNFNKMVQNLRQLVGGMGNAARELLTASETLAFNSQEAGYVTEQVSATIQEVATGAGRLAEDAGHGSDLVEEIAVLAEHMLAQATEAGASSAQVREMARDALLVVNEQNRAVEQTVSAVDNAETTIRQLNSYSEEIGRIVEIIGGISGQTDLLALNAAVEAARAGEHGLGFAVVAEQVRVLAEQTDNSTKEIADLIKRVKLGTEKAVQEMNSSRQAAANAQSAVHQTAASFRNITVAIEQTDKEVASITAGLETLQQHTQSVVQVIHSVSAVSTESAASAEEVTAASQEQTSQIMQIGEAANVLSKLANQLQSAIGAFKLND
jgi:methyl-accepting chemotaxis protein